MATLLVALSGMLGVLARFGLGRVTLHHHGLLWTTVAINVLGSFLLGLAATEPWLSRTAREAIGVGFLGGFTTFSTFSVLAVIELDAGRTGTAALYLVASVGGGIAAATIGYWLGRALH